MKLKRNNRTYSICRPFTDAFILMCHKIECHGRENIPKKGPALLLVKHQSNKDIPLEGYFLNKYCNRYGNWVMKASLPLIFEYIGGIRFKRLKDLKKIRNREKRREELENAKSMNQNAMNYIEWLYKNNEIVVVHPEGKKYPGEIGEIKKSIISFTKQVQEKYGIEIPIIPIGIEYAGKGFRSKVYLRAGNPINFNSNNIEEIIYNEIKTLSNLH